MTEQQQRQWDSLLLHWSPRSPFVRKVMIAARETGAADLLRLRRTVVAMSAPSAELMEHNPLSKLPTLVVIKDDGVLDTIFDSSVICEWLDHHFSPKALLPSAAEDRLRARKFEALGDGLLDLLLIWLEERLRPEKKRSSAHIEAYRTKFRSTLRYLDASLPEFNVRSFDIGQLAIGCALSYADFRFASENWRRGHDKLAEWHGRFNERQSVIATPVSDDLDPRAVVRLQY